jgi:ABC-type nitrate/sulfonate/bicarbonate transport system substrate-binding protein
MPRQYALVLEVGKGRPSHLGGDNVRAKSKKTALPRREFIKLAGASALATTAISFAGIRYAGAQDLQPVALAVAAGLDTSPQFAAIDQGIFEKHGLAVTPNIKFSGVELLNSAVSGESLISVVGTTVTASAIQNGIGIKIIALEHGSPVQEFYSTCRIVAGPDRGIEPGKLETLKGKTIGMPLGTDGEAGALAYLKSVGLTRDDVQLVQVAPPDMVSAITSGSVDAVSFVEPWATIVELNAPGSFRVTSEQPDWYGPGVIITSDDTIANHRDLLVKYLTAVAEAQHWARANLEGELLAVNSRWTQIPTEVAEKAITQINFDPRLSKSVLRSLEHSTIPALIDIGVIDKPIAMDKLIDTSMQKEVQDNHPEFFADLPAIPADDML